MDGLEDMLASTALGAFSRVRRGLSGELEAIPSLGHSSLYQAVLGARTGP